FRRFVGTMKSEKWISKVFTRKQKSPKRNAKCLPNLLSHMLRISHRRNSATTTKWNCANLLTPNLKQAKAWIWKKHFQKRKKRKPKAMLSTLWKHCANRSTMLVLRNSPVRKNLVNEKPDSAWTDVIHHSCQKSSS